MNTLILLLTRRNHKDRSVTLMETVTDGRFDLSGSQHNSHAPALRGLSSVQAFYPFFHKFCIAYSTTG